MPNDGSMDVLPLGTCTSGSLGIGNDFSGTTPLKVVENRSIVSLVETVTKEEETKTDATHLEHTNHEDDEEKVVEEENVVEGEKVVEEENVFEEEKVGEEKNVVEEEKVIEEKNVVEEEKVVEEKNVVEEEKEGEEAVKKDREHHIETEAAIVSTFSPVVGDNESTKENLVNALTEKTAATSLSSGSQEEKMASGVLTRPVLSGMPSHAQSRGLSAASLALKKKQAAKNTALALKAVSIESPETDSIMDRIKMFGGANSYRAGGSKKFNVKDMIQKYKDVEELSQEQIAHVARGHASSEPPGVCMAYSLSTASRPTTALRPTPRRKMSHELSENEARDVTRRGSNDEDRMGVSQESVQSVRNAKSLFENLARAESAAAQL